VEDNGDFSGQAKNKGVIFEDDNDRQTNPYHRLAQTHSNGFNKNAASNNHHPKGGVGQSITAGAFELNLDEIEKEQLQ
jgi:hypothetical protein